jgi:Secretion system C-terminal sorting domain
MIRSLIVVCLYSINHLFGQYNLVPNSSFETCLNCPNYGVIGDQFTSNNVILPNWNNPGAGVASPDYLVCNTTNPQAQDGNNIVGIGTFISPFEEIQWQNVREYMQCELIDSLIFKENYLITFYSLVGVPSNSGNGAFISNNFGVHFSDTLLHSEDPYVIQLNSQIKYFKNEIISDTSTWTKVSGIYVADGGEKFMTVGNFNTDLETDYKCIWSFWPATGFTYMWLDNFSVTPLDSIPGGLQVNAGNDQSICIGDTVFIGEKISNLPANWYLLDGTIVDTNTAGVYVHPSVTTTYVVTMTINGVYSTDTVTVTVGCAGVDELEKPSFRIGPNPNDGQFTINGQFSEGDIISIISTEGRLMHTVLVNQQTDFQSINLKLKSGTYFLEIQNESRKTLYRNSILILDK